MTKEKPMEIGKMKIKGNSLVWEKEKPKMVFNDGRRLCNHPWQDARLDCLHCNPEEKPNSIHVEKRIGIIPIEKPCDCWIIHGYGIDGICLHCYNRRVKREAELCWRLYKKEIDFGKFWTERMEIMGEFE